MKNFLHHLLFPRESNNHRSKLLHHDSLLIILCLFLFCTSLFAVTNNTYPQVLGIATDIAPSDLLTITNKDRADNGLKPLAMNNQLTVAAQAKAKHMFAHNYWAHIAPDGTTPWVFIKNSGYDYLYAGENLARGFTTAPAVVAAWMASPTHRENMLSTNYNDVGFAIQTGTLTGSQTILVVEEFGSRYVGQEDVDTAAISEVSPTPVVLAVSSPAPTVVPQTEQQSATGVAALQNQPLFDTKSLSREISFGILFLLLVVLIIDAVIIEKKKIARLSSHNVDHIVFITIIIIVAIIVSRGLIV